LAKVNVPPPAWVAKTLGDGFATDEPPVGRPITTRGAERISNGRDVCRRRRPLISGANAPWALLAVV